MEVFIYEFSANSDLPKTLAGPCLEIKTCQRSLLLSKTELPTVQSQRKFKGADAYEFLVRFASGLESEIKGETDVFGQVKSAYKNFTETQPEESLAFKTLFLKLFEDTKEIRAQYLHGIGGNTYGTLARRLLNPTSSDRIVILGAGQISKSVAPYFADASLTIFNRSAPRLQDLSQELLKKGYSHIRFISDEKSLQDSLKQAKMIIIATPAKAELDFEVLKHAPQNSKILHLGGQAHEVTHLSHQNFTLLSLSDLFAMEKEQTLFREKQIKQAMDACHSRAILRSMAPSIHIPHGWEDLALF